MGGLARSFDPRAGHPPSARRSISPLLILRHEKMHAIQTHGALTHQIDSLSPGMIASVRLPFFTVARADWLRRISSGTLRGGKGACGAKIPVVRSV